MHYFSVPILRGGAPDYVVAGCVLRLAMLHHAHAFTILRRLRHLPQLFDQRPNSFDHRVVAILKN